MLEDKSLNSSNPPEDFNSYLSIAVKAIADQISKKFIEIEAELDRIENRVYNIAIKSDPKMQSELVPLDLVTSSTTQDSDNKTSLKKKKSQIKDNDLLSALKLIEDGEK